MEHAKLSASGAAGMGFSRRTIATLLAVAVGLATLILILTGGNSGNLAYAQNTISAKALTDHECDSTEWHFVITQIDTAAHAPANITVTWSNGDSEVVPLGKKHRQDSPLRHHLESEQHGGVRDRHDLRRLVVSVQPEPRPMRGTDDPADGAADDSADQLSFLPDNASAVPNLPLPLAGGGFALMGKGSRPRCGSERRRSSCRRRSLERRTSLPSSGHPTGTLCPWFPARLSPTAVHLAAISRPTPRMRMHPATTPRPPGGPYSGRAHRPPSQWRGGAWPVAVQNRA